MAVMIGALAFPGLLQLMLEDFSLIMPTKAGMTFELSPEDSSLAGESQL